MNVFPRPQPLCFALLLLSMTACGESDSTLVDAPQDMAVLGDQGGGGMVPGDMARGRDMGGVPPDAGVSDQGRSVPGDVGMVDGGGVVGDMEMDGGGEMGTSGVASCAGVGAVHVAPKALGSGDGRDPLNAAGFEEVNAMLGKAGPGGLVCLAGGEYPAGGTLSQGGVPGNPVTLMAASDEVVFRDTFEATSSNKFGKSALVITASDLTLQGIRCEKVGQCVSIPKTDGLMVANVTLRELHISQVGTGIDITRSGGQTVRNLTIEGVMVLQFTRGGIFFGSTTKGAKVLSSYLDMQPEKLGGARGSDYPVGIGLYNDIQDVTIEDTTVLNVLGKPTGYTQGDGLDGERTARGITIKDSFFAGHRDGCVDTKSRETLIENTVAIGCKRNFRLWQNDEGDGPRCSGCSSYQPRNAHIFTKGSTPARFDSLSVYSDNDSKLLVLDGEGDVVIDGLKGTLADEEKANVKAIKNSTLTYAQPFMTPMPPNPTRFSP